jgi:hypothetical protein
MRRAQEQPADAAEAVNRNSYRHGSSFRVDFAS